MVIIGVWVFLMSEIPLQWANSFLGPVTGLPRFVDQSYRGTSLIRNCPPPRTIQ